MADLIARHDWASTPLGAMAGWPSCLKTAVDLMLATPQPVSIGWGADPVVLYNDGYIPILGRKHPAVLGKPYGETWPEMWGEFRPVAKAVMAGEARCFEDLPVALTGRPGRPMSWFTFSWTPLRGSDGRVGGFYCAAIETSGQVLARQESQRFRSLFQASPASFLILKPDTPRFTIIEVNDAYLAATMRRRDEVIGRGMFEAFPDDPDDPTATGVRNLRASLERALASRRPDVMPIQKYNVARPDGTFEERWWSPANSPVLGVNGEVTAIIHHVSDVTRQYRAETAARQSAAQLKLAVEIGGIGHWSLDLATNTLTTSATCRRNFGRPADEPFPYEALVASIHPGDRERQQQAVRAAIEARSSFDIEYRLITPAGETRWAAVRGRHEDDERPRLVGVSLNITERKRAEQAMRESEERQAFLLKLSDALRAETGVEAMGNRAVGMVAEHLRLDRCWISKVFEDQGVSTVGPERIRPDLSPMAGAFRLSDYPETMRQLMLERMFVEDAAGDRRFAGSEKELFARLHLRALLVVPLRKGERRVVWALAAAMAEPRQWTDGERVLLKEVAERTWAALEGARAEEALLENQQRLEEANRTKDRFLAMLGHELRNPLAPIVTTLQLMKLRAPETLKHEREIIASQTHALVDMVDDLLDVARIARGNLKLDRHPLRIADIVEEAAATAAWALTEHRQTLHTNVDPGLMVLGDRRRLVQVVVNLLVNAAKYSPPDRRIDIDVARDAEAAVIRVRDQGNGMEPALLARVFEAFSQAEQSSDRRRGGLGLGLAIVRNIVELHGGSVAAASEGTDKGSEFTVRLPLLHDVEGGSPEGAAETEARSPPACAPVRVLLVDDHVAGAQSMGALLEAMGYKVHIEHDGPAALAAAKTNAPAIALLDIGLPGMDGYELARAFRAMPDFSKLPLVALTGYGQVEDRERARAAGFDEHVTKPVRSEDLVPLIEKLVHAR